MSFDSLRDNPNLVGRSGSEDAEDSLRRFGYSEDDFTVSVIDDTQPTTGLSHYYGRAHFKYEPTGKEKTYKTGHGSTWLYEFDQDLENGYFKN